MNKIIGFLLLLTNVVSASQVTVYSDDGKFGLKSDTNVITEAQYKKLIPLGETSYIALKGYKYGIVNNKGEVILDFKYSHANRILGKFVKFQNHKGVGLYDEYAKEIITQEQDSIELLHGGMFLVSNKYKYGVTDFNGTVLISNVCDDIYMPKPNVMRIRYKGEWFEIEQVNSMTLTLPKDVQSIKENSDFKITKLVTSPIMASKYSLVATTDYSLKIFSSISPAYEATIDELMLSQGADAISVITRVSWIPMFPFVYAKNYYKTFRNPNNGPLSEIKNSIKYEF